MRIQKFISVLLVVVMLAGCGNRKSREEAKLREIGKQYYETYKDDVFCEEDEYVECFIKLINEGYDEQESARAAALLHMKIIQTHSGNSGAE